MKFEGKRKEKTVTLKDNALKVKHSKAESLSNQALEFPYEIYLRIHEQLRSTNVLIGVSQGFLTFLASCLKVS